MDDILGPIGFLNALRLRGAARGARPIGVKEAEARRCVATPALFYGRMNRALSVLKQDVRRRFGKVRYCFEELRVYSADGSLWLEWRTRSRPDEPEGSGNKQTSRGTVICCEAALRAKGAEG